MIWWVVYRWGFATTLVMNFKFNFVGHIFLVMIYSRRKITVTSGIFSGGLTNWYQNDGKYYVLKFIPHTVWSICAITKSICKPDQYTQLFSKHKFRRKISMSKWRRSRLFPFRWTSRIANWVRYTSAWFFGKWKSFKIKEIWTRISKLWRWFHGNI